MKSKRIVRNGHEIVTRPGEVWVEERRRSTNGPTNRRRVPEYMFSCRPDTSWGRNEIRILRTKITRENARFQRENNRCFWDLKVVSGSPDGEGGMVHLSECGVAYVYLYFRYRAK